MADKAVNEGKDRLESEEFVDLIPHLPIGSMLKIEYFINAWKLLLEYDRIKNIYSCNLCSVKQSGLKNTIAHIRGKRHNANISNVKHFFHPEYTYSKAQQNQKQNSVTTKQANSVTAITKPQLSVTSNILPNVAKNGTRSKKATEAKKEILNKGQSQPNCLSSGNPGTVTDQRNVAKVSDQNLVKKQNEKNTPLLETTVASLKEVVPAKLQMPLETKVKNIPQNAKEFNQSTKSMEKRNPAEKCEQKANAEKCVSGNKKLVENPLSFKRKSVQIQETQKRSKMDEQVIVIEDNENISKMSQTKNNNNINEMEKKTPTHQPSKVSEKSKGVTSSVGKLQRCDPTYGKSGPYQSNRAVIPTVQAAQHRSQKNIEENLTFLSNSKTSNMPPPQEVCGFVGVEYVIRICRNGNALKYECALCELELTGNAMQNHLLGYNHRLKFCEKHFPTAIQQFRQYIANIPLEDHYKVMIPVLQKLAVAIERHHGRSLPLNCSETRSFTEKHKIYSEVFSRQHASEQCGPTFTHVVDSKEIDEFILGKDDPKKYKEPTGIFFNNSVNQINNTREQHSYNNSINFTSIAPTPNYSFHQSNIQKPTYEVVDDELHKQMVNNFLKATNIDIYSQAKPIRNNRLKDDFSENLSPYPRQPHSSIKFKSFEKSNSNSFDIWQSYCRLVDIEINNLNTRFQQYQGNPESHPSYKNEWLKFWQRRKAELILTGEDYKTYNYQPEWVDYFKNRIKELYVEAVEAIKIKTREELSLPMTNEHLREPKYHIQKATLIRPNNQISFSQASVTAHGTKAAINPVNSMENINVNDGVDNHSRSAIATTDFQDKRIPKVVSVLRLLTALEEYLGSMGPKIVSLLSKALQAEKVSPSSSISVLTEENCTLLETAMEKFKGLVITGILENVKERALRKAITEVNSLLDFAREMVVEFPNKIKTFGDNKKGFDHKIQTKRPDNCVNSTSLTSTSTSKETHTYEEKIAAALAAQGRTDVDREQLEQLAAICVMLKRKRENNEQSSETLLRKYENSNNSTMQSVSVSASGVNAPYHENLGVQNKFANTSATHSENSLNYQKNLNLSSGYNKSQNSNLMSQNNRQENLNNTYNFNNRKWNGSTFNLGVNRQIEARLQLEKPQQNALSNFYRNQNIGHLSNTQPKERSNNTNNYQGSFRNSSSDKFGFK